MNYLDYFSINSIVIIAYFVISLLVLILNKLFLNKLVSTLFSTYRSSLLNPLTYLRLILHIFGHLNWQHFSSNFTIILLIGPMIEEKYGSKNLLIMMIICAAVTGLLHNMFSKNKLCGASGIAFMLIILSSFVNVSNGKLPVTLILISLFYIVNELIGIFKHDNISHFGHLIGAVCGIIFGIYFT